MMTIEVMPAEEKKQIQSMQTTAIQLKQMTEEENKAYHMQRRRRIILDYAAKHVQRTIIDREVDFEKLTWFQEHWVQTKMSGTARSWERWGGMIEGWEPWNRY